MLFYSAWLTIALINGDIIFNLYKIIRNAVIPGVGTTIYSNT